MDGNGSLNWRTIYYKRVLKMMYLVVHVMEIIDIMEWIIDWLKESWNNVMGLLSVVDLIIPLLIQMDIMDWVNGSRTVSDKFILFLIIN